MGPSVTASATSNYVTVGVGDEIFGVDPHPRLLPRLRAVEKLGDVAAARRPWKLASYHSRRAGADPVERRRVADHDAWPDPLAMRNPTRSCSGGVARPPRHRPAQAHAPCRAGTAAPHAHCLTATPRQKCSGDFSANALICLDLPPEFAQVGLKRDDVRSKKARQRAEPFLYFC